MLILGMGGTTHFWNLDFSRADLHRERVLLQRVSLERILFECRLTAHAFFEAVVKPDHPVDDIFLDGPSSLVSCFGLPTNQQCSAAEGLENHCQPLNEASKIDLR